MPSTIIAQNPFHLDAGWLQQGVIFVMFLLMVWKVISDLRRKPPVDVDLATINSELRKVEGMAAGAMTKADQVAGEVSRLRHDLGKKIDKVEQEWEQQIVRVHDRLDGIAKDTAAQGASLQSIVATLDRIDRSLQAVIDRQFDAAKPPTKAR